jgi:hypothetical protein
MRIFGVIHLNKTEITKPVVTFCSSFFLHICRRGEIALNERAAEILLWG